MRKSAAAVLAVGSAFALTAAAAAFIAVTGPFDKAAGLGAASTCDIGDTTVETMTNGAAVTGFRVTTSLDSSYTPADGEDPASGQAACENATIWVRVDFTYLPSEEDPKQILSMNAWFPANGDYRGGKELLVGDTETTAWWAGFKGWTDPAVDPDPDTPYTGVWLNEVALLRSDVLVSETTPEFLEWTANENRPTPAP